MPFFSTKQWVLALFAALSMGATSYGLDAAEPWSPEWVSSQAQKYSKLHTSLINQAHASGGEDSIKRLERAGLASELEALYRRNATVDQRQNSLKKEQALPPASAAPEEYDYNLNDLDQKLDDQTAVSNKIEGLDLAASMSQMAQEEAAKRLKKAEANLRAFLDSQGTKPLSPQQQWQKEELELHQEIAQARQHLEEYSHENQLLERSLRQVQLVRINQEITTIQENLHFAPEDLERQLEKLRQNREGLEARQNALKKQQSDIENAWLNAKDEQDKGQQLDYLRRANLQVQTREAWRNTYQKVLEQTELQLTWISVEEKLWRYRYALLESKPKANDLSEWAGQTLKSLKTLERQLQLQQAGQAALQSEQLAVPETQGKSKFEAQLINNRRQAVRKLIERGLEFQSSLYALKALHLRTQDEILRAKKGLKLTQKIGAVGSKAWEIWDYELWVIDEKPVTLKKALYALVLFVLGLLGAKRVTVSFRRRVLPSLDLDESSAATTEKILHYFLIFLLVLMTLNLVNIPLTAFTFLGGAIAIAFGFGAQNLLNNFISGFIIMAERPIKIGDMIEMEDSFGIVEEIGARCTRIRTPTNVHVLVPNSAFLEKNITNWTLSNMQVRTNVKVGVAYGSPVEEVKECLLQVTGEHPRISFEPRPEVFFRDFADSSLNFAVFFSLTLQNLTDRYRIQSDIRFAIIKAFEEKGISISFPQRDLHLVDSSELKVRLMKPTEEG